MERNSLEAVNEDLRRYQVIIGYHTDNPSRIGPNREYLVQVRRDGSPLYFRYTPEIYTLASTLSKTLDKLLAQN